MSENTLLSVGNLRTRIETDGKPLYAVDDVSFSVDDGETVCIVGESGSGKSVTCRSLTRLVSDPVEVVSGTVDFDGTALHDASAKLLREMRGNRIAHIFQNPQQALDPVYTVGDQITETLTLHGDTENERERAIELLRRVGIPRAETRVDDYPHEFSGGMAQRVAIAVALAGDPDLLIADEPTTAVDVTVQARLIELLQELTREGMSLLLVTHNFRMVAALADRVLVMFGGTIVERGPTPAVFETPAHPYTQTLFESYSGLDRRGDRQARGDIPTDGCRFREDCPYAIDACAGGDQPLSVAVPEGDAHDVSCVHYEGGDERAEILAAAREASPTAKADDKATETESGGKAESAQASDSMSQTPKQQSPTEGDDE